LWRVAKGLKFPQWLTLICGTDIGMAVTQNSVLDNASAIPSILHAMKFQVLSMCRTHPVEEASIIQGVIDMEDLGTLRVAGHVPAGEQLGTAADTQWDTDKHKVLWMVRTDFLRAAAGIAGVSAQHAPSSSTLWQGKGKKARARSRVGPLSKVRAQRERARPKARDRV
jgi:hypothetical protein